MLVLRPVVEIFDRRHLDDERHLSGLEENDWEYITMYLKIVAPFEAASKLLGGDTYPAACMVVPMLDQVRY